MQQDPPEALKANVNMTVEEKYPHDCKEGHIVKLPKEGDLVYAVTIEE